MSGGCPAGRLEGVVKPETVEAKRPADSDRRLQRLGAALHPPSAHPSDEGPPIDRLIQQLRACSRRDPAVSLAFVAAHTQRVKLGTGIIILPQRNPLVLAKELASVDVVSGGRLIFGLGIGYLKAEFDALGVSFEDKGARAVEYLEAILTLWTAPQPEYHGHFVSFAGIQSLPRPVQSPHPPIVIGGHSPQAYRRAVTHGNGWYGFALDSTGTASCLAELRTARAKWERPERLGELEISVTPRGPLDLDTVKRYAELGVHRLIPYWPFPMESALRERVARFGDEVIGKL